MSQDPQARDARLAVEVEADVGLERLAAVYAEGFLKAAEKAGQTEALLDEFDSLLADVLGRFPKLEEILASGIISHEEKVGILDRALGPQASALFLSFLKVVSRHRRLDCLRAIHRQTHEQYQRMRGRVPVRVSTAAPIDNELARRIADNLRSIVDGEPILEQIVDPDLIGGVVVRVGDIVYDGSVATRLEEIRQQMIRRSGNEIQSRRDRFRHPAGN